MKNNGREKKSNRHILLAILFLCVIALVFTASNSSASSPLYQAAEVVFSPMQNGINKIGSFFLGINNQMRSKQELLQENKDLQDQVDQLQEENNVLVLQTSELSDLQQLYGLSDQYSNYKTTGAYVIAKNSGNWFDTFTINKGSKDGIETGMNVLAGSGLAGIVTEVSPHTATVRSIIDNSSDVSAMLLSSGDNFFVTGSLASMNEDQSILYSDLAVSSGDASGDTSGDVKEGDAVVTSYISDRYLPGLLIGYVKTVEKDYTNLTYSGTITPAVDFQHLRTVLVILDKKQQEGD